MTTTLSIEVLPGDSGPPERYYMDDLGNSRKDYLEFIRRYMNNCDVHLRLHLKKTVPEILRETLDQIVRESLQKGWIMAHRDTRYIKIPGNYTAKVESEYYPARQGYNVVIRCLANGQRFQHSRFITDREIQRASTM